MINKMDKERAIQLEIYKLQAELEELQNSKFEFEYKENKTYLIENTYVKGGYSNRDNYYLDYGLYRIHRHNAQKQLRLNKESNVIGAMIEQLEDTEWIPSWAVTHQSKYFISWDELANEYIISESTVKHLGVNYMNKDMAEQICKILNKGDVKI
jgi:hypothetical protein